MARTTQPVVGATAQRIGRRRFNIALALACLVSAACNGDQASPSTHTPTSRSAAPTTSAPIAPTPESGPSSLTPAEPPAQSAAPTTAPTAPEPRLEQVPCTSELFAGLSISPDARCSTLTVPEDRSDPTGRLVVLPVVVYPATVTPSQPVPMVYISGGPGASAVGLNFNERTLATDRDFIVVDHRGTGRATPSLECPEVDEVTWADLAAGADTPTRDQHQIEAYARCRDRLVTIADLNQYDTPTVAQDFVDLRTALGVEQWIPYGVSYGTAVAQQLLRTDQQGTFAAILDSVVAPDLDAGPVGEARRLRDAIARLTTACAADPSCASRYPDFGAAIAAIRDRLNATPFAVEFTDAAGVERIARLTGDDITWGAFQAMYDTALIPVLPSIASQLEAGNDAILKAVASPILGTNALTSDGQTQSVLCADRAATAERLTPEQAQQEFGYFAALTSATLSCDEWDVEPVESSFHDIVPTDVPTLVLAGSLDPVTPAANTARIAALLGGTTLYVEFDGFGHAVLFTGNECAHAIANSFIVAPTVDTDISCVDRLPAIAWA
jgi:pimeloyl-ACP methyl ester carboxylesterase